MPRYMPSILAVALIAAVSAQPANTVAPKAMGQAKKTVPNSVVMPKPSVDLTAGTWKYKATDVIPAGTYDSTFSVTIKDDSGMWTINTAWDFPDGPVTDVSTVEKGTLTLRKESFKHFAKAGRPWVPVAINLDFTGNKVTGTTTIVSGQSKSVAVDLGGALFADATGTDVTIGCLPLADGYTTTFRNWDIEKLKERLVQLEVVGTESVAVLAGTFDSYKVELTSADGGPNKETVWIAKDSRVPVKTYELQVLNKANMVTTTELVP